MQHDARATDENACRLLFRSRPCSLRICTVIIVAVLIRQLNSTHQATYKSSAERED